MPKIDFTPPAGATWMTPRQLNAITLADSRTPVTPDRLKDNTVTAVQKIQK